MPQFSSPIAALCFHGVPVKTTEPGFVGTSCRPSVLGPTQPTPHVVVTSAAALGCDSSSDVPGSGSV